MSRDTEAVLSLMRQLARARRLAEIAQVIATYTQGRGDIRIGAFLADLVPGIYSNYYVPTYGTDVFEQFVEWGLGHPDWGRPLVIAAASGDGGQLARASEQILKAASTLE